MKFDFNKKNEKRFLLINRLNEGTLCIHHFIVYFYFICTSVYLFFIITAVVKNFTRFNANQGGTVNLKLEGKYRNLRIW